METDTLVAAHYRNFDVAQAHPVRLRRAVRGYVSYRRNGRVYWTSKRLVLPKGELVLTDGVHLARTRCGNRVVENRKLIPPEELRRDPEEAAVIRELDDPEPPNIAGPTFPGLTFPPLPPLLTSTDPPGEMFLPLGPIPTSFGPNNVNKVPDWKQPSSSEIPPVPEPPTFLLLLSGACGLGVRAWRRGRSLIRSGEK
jgi:hypothetical protein